MPQAHWINLSVFTGLIVATLGYSVYRLLNAKK